jgi:hypothetical protein
MKTDSRSVPSGLALIGRLLGLILLWVVVALLAAPARSAPPPDLQLLVSGESVRMGRLPDSVDLPDGTLLRGDIEPDFAAVMLEDDALYLWIAASNSVTKISDSSLGLPQTLVAVYSSLSGRLEWGLLDSGPIADIQIERQSGGSATLASVLAEPGSFVVLNPQILKATTPVPEAGTGALIASGAVALLSWVSRRGRATQLSLA